MNALAMEKTRYPTLKLRVKMVKARVSTGLVKIRMEVKRPQSKVLTIKVSGVPEPHPDPLDEDPVVMPLNHRAGLGPIAETPLDEDPVEMS